ncbi:MAG: hypothetical protein Ta2E_09490 [Mycoplasmoidaceae bacterium]|nr:MAG: hypothetical protein Ta2E_09490 [Mycoplasmoidaceae bacterium]
MKCNPTDMFERWHKKVENNTLEINEIKNERANLKSLELTSLESANDLFSQIQDEQNNNHNIMTKTIQTES